MSKEGLSFPTGSIEFYPGSGESEEQPDDCAGCLKNIRKIDGGVCARLVRTASYVDTEYEDPTCGSTILDDIALRSGEERVAEILAMHERQST